MKGRTKTTFECKIAQTEISAVISLKLNFLPYLSLMSEFVNLNPLA